MHFWLFEGRVGAQAGGSTSCRTVGDLGSRVKRAVSGVVPADRDRVPHASAPRPQLGTNFQECKALPACRENKNKEQSSKRSRKEAAWPKKRVAAPRSQPPDPTAQPPIILARMQTGRHCARVSAALLSILSSSQAVALSGENVLHLHAPGAARRLRPRAG